MPAPYRPLALPQDYDALEALPAWPERLQHALGVVDAEYAKHCAELSAGLDLVYQRVCALAEYRTDYKLDKTVITLVRPIGAEADNRCGLDKVRVHSCGMRCPLVPQ